MKYLLDTHTFIWAYAQTDRLPPKARLAIQDTSSVIFVSAITFWEIAIKLRAKRLDIGGKTSADMITEAGKMDFKVIELTPVEAASQERLTESTHFDPFDRMIIWQAIQRNLTLISGDRAFGKFTHDGLKLLWD